jgi:hypothetical protein
MTKKGDSAPESSVSGGTTSVTLSSRPDLAAIASNTRVRAWAGPVPPAWATRSRSWPPEAISAPSTSRCSIPVLARASLG